MNIVKMRSAHKREHRRVQEVCRKLHAETGPIYCAQTRAVAGLLAFLLSWSRDGSFYYLVLGWGDAKQSLLAHL